MMFYMALPIHNITTSQPNAVRSNSPKRSWASAKQSLVRVVPGVLEQLIAAPAISWQWNPPLTVAHRGSPCTLARAFLGSCYVGCESFKGRRFNVVSSCKTCQAAKTFSHPGALEHSYTFCRSFKTNQVDQGGNQDISRSFFRKATFWWSDVFFLKHVVSPLCQSVIKLLALRRIRRSGILQPAWQNQRCGWPLCCCVNGRSNFDFTTINNYKL